MRSFVVRLRSRVRSVGSRRLSLPRSLSLGGVLGSPSVEVVGLVVGGVSSDNTVQYHFHACLCMSSFVRFDWQGWWCCASRMWRQHQVTC